MRIIIGVLLLLFVQYAIAQEDKEISSQVKIEHLPIPNEKGQLFYLQRDPDSNTIVYALNSDNGAINEDNPVSAYWIRYSENGQKKDLSFIQRSMAYGIRHKMTAPDTFELHIQAYKPLLITLAPHPQTGKYQATVQMKNKKIILDRIFVRIKGGSFFKPNVQYIEIFGRNMENHRKVSHRFSP